MKILLKAVRITDTQSPHHNTSKDLLIEEGHIKGIATSIDDPEATLISVPQLHVSQGWVDFKCGFNDPGSDEGGGLLKGLDDAAVGGFTHVGVLPDDQPATDSRSAVEYKFRTSSTHAVQIHPIGAISKGLHGKHLAEMADMKEAGTRWFSDNQALNARLYLQALQYSNDLNASIMIPAYSTDYQAVFQVNEGLASTRTGLPGHPSFDETLQVLQAIELAKYTGNPIHITGISCKESIPLIEQAKNAGVPLTCDVHAMNLCFTEERVLSFDTRFKVRPVLRSEEDRKNLILALKSGIIDAVVSDHHSVISDNKRVPFIEACFGALQLPSLYAGLTHFSGLGSDLIVELLSLRNRQTFGIPTHPIDARSFADLTLYLPNASVNDSPLADNALNPFATEPLIGKALGIIRGSNFILNQ
ncbi:MAG: hypothetical protein EBS17_02640 [Flavobacteriia bacterium]|nr:hypothetical protein [Flavobacteriia bacterium]